ncbi:MarR family transcriptional regulator [Arthrobacter sp. CAU 1506]|uniref:MarR family winged helix-turn-helix transcriptional regulator n=1 Tax=Arthrobacter sp. CAU 1506 TaxID=2560052 RepID=UPI0010ACAD70|nr:MarR family transcriptional regulator [Arthrobacter sp. CAU 1506]TJY64665.1 MarR family transcriptional regulator [Arthrobacter sp. CAU 1506]
MPARPAAIPAEPRDHVDGVRQQWQQIFPGLETDAMEIVTRINRIAQIVQQRSDSILTANGITRAEFDMLSLLARSGRPMSPTELAAELLISGAGATKRIKTLQNAGLIVRETNPKDGRGALINTTPRARGLLRPILESVLDFEAGLLSGLDRTTATDLARNLRTLLTSLELPSSSG